MSKTALRRKPEKPSKLGKLPEWNLTDLYPGLDSPQIKRDLEQGDRDCRPSSRSSRAGWRRLRPARAPDARWPKRSSATRRSTTCSAGSSPMPALVYAGNTTDPGARQVLRRRAGAHHGGLAASAVLHARAQPHRRRAAGSGDGRSRARPLSAVDRGRAQGKALPARRPGRATLPRKVGDRLFGLEPAVRRDHRRPCVSRSAASSWRSSRRSICCRTSTARSARRPPRRWPRPSRKICGRSR